VFCLSAPNILPLDNNCSKFEPRTATIIRMPAKYQPLPTEPQHSPSFSSRASSPSPSHAALAYPPLYENNSFDSNHDIEQEAPRQRVRRDSIPSFDSDPRFHQPTPSPFVRAGLLLFTAFLFWLAFNMRKTMWVETGMGMNRRPAQEVDPSY
jgi:hypothetical protein